MGDYSSTVKVFDLRSSSNSSGGGGGILPLEPVAIIPNSPAFCGDACPVAGLYRSPAAGAVSGGSGDVCGGLLVSSSIGWWTANRRALEEAPEDQDQPIACLNMHWAANPAHPVPSSPPPMEYLHTLRLRPGVVTCMAAAGEEAGGGATSDSELRVRFLVGTSAGDLIGVAVAARTGSSKKKGGGGDEVEGEGEGGLLFDDGLAMGLEELSDDESDEDKD